MNDEHDASRAEAPFYILADAPTVEQRVLKHGDTFAVFDLAGDIQQVGLREQGIYHEGTRFLSACQLKVGGVRPLLLSSTIQEDNDLLIVNLTNPDLVHEMHPSIPRGTLHLCRSKFLWMGACYERIFIKNYGLTTVQAPVEIRWDADFVDIFEVRGIRRLKRGTTLPPIHGPNAIVMAYRGLDGIERRTRVDFTNAPQLVSGNHGRWNISLRPHEDSTVDITVRCEPQRTKTSLLFDHAHRQAQQEFESTSFKTCTIRSSKQHFNDWVSRSIADLHLMTTRTESGPFPYAGVPWFSTPFGRDSLITALECLWFDPSLARGVLAFLAATQATEFDAAQDAEPGKILHEMREGEMANLKEIPFGRYYGSVDATPLFVLLAGAYFRRTADRTFLKSVWPNIEMALQWIDRFGDRDGDGFVEYERGASTGLANQGWKDSHEAVFHADGTLASGPIALCEVQAYVFGAKRAAADIAEDFGWIGRAIELRQQADELRSRFESAFWCDSIGSYVLALDGAKRPCRVRSSNAGHCLYTGLASSRRAEQLVQTLMHGDSFSGWGVRTVAVGESRYNPMSYHNGSVWPHDSALVATGLAHYGKTQEVLQIMSGLYDATRHFDLNRIPELFCGFERRPGEGPVLYPVACSPQSWAAASVFQLLQACLGLEICAPESSLRCTYSVLPPFLNEIRIENLVVGEASVDLLFTRHAHDVGVTVLRRKGRLEITLNK